MRDAGARGRRLPGPPPDEESQTSRAKDPVSKAAAAADGKDAWAAASDSQRMQRTETNRKLAKTTRQLKEKEQMPKVNIAAKDEEMQEKEAELAQKKEELEEIENALADAHGAHERKATELDKQLQEQTRKIAALQAKYEPHEGVPDASAGGAHGILNGEPN